MASWMRLSMRLCCLRLCACCAGTLQFACLQWAGARQADRVRHLYLDALLRQVGLPVGWLSVGC